MKMRQKVLPKFQVNCGCVRLIKSGYPLFVSKQAKQRDKNNISNIDIDTKIEYSKHWIVALIERSDTTSETTAVTECLRADNSYFRWVGCHFIDFRFCDARLLIQTEKLREREREYWVATCCIAILILYICVSFSCFSANRHHTRCG